MERLEMEHLRMVGYSKDRTRILLSGEDPDSPMFWASADNLLEALTGLGVVPPRHRGTQAGVRPTPVRPASPPPPAAVAAVRPAPATVLPAEEMPTGEVPAIDDEVGDYTAELFEAWAGFVKRTPAPRPHRRSA